MKLLRKTTHRDCFLLQHIQKKTPLQLLKMAESCGIRMPLGYPYDYPI